jgi:ferredoxin
MALPQILVDDDKCDDPLSCRRCLLVCPSRVLGLGTSVGPEKYREIDPHHFVVRGVRFQFCTGCLKCVDVCPTDAIQISFDGSEAA